MTPRPLIVLAGPTGTGKSDLALELAVRLGGEVVNADAMQLYRGMDIGTAKVPPAERRGVPHHLLDVLEVTETASVAVYAQRAGAVIDDIRGRGRTPLLVGGSGLYLQAVIDGIEFPGTDPAIRARIEREVELIGSPAAHDRLAALDPAAAAVILPTNTRRIVRALEVIELTGRPFSATMPKPGAPRFGAVLFCLDRDTDELDRRLADRVDRMLAAGFVDEVAALLDRGLRDGRTASRALGYQQLIDVIDGRRELDAAAADTITATRRFVRRQRSWFRRDPRLTWLDAAAPDLLDVTLDSITAAGPPTLDP